MTEWLIWTELRQEKLKKLFMNELYCKVLSQKFHSSLIYKTSESQQRLYLEKLWRHRLNNTTVSVNSNNKVREKNFTMKKKWRKKVYNENMPGCSVTRMCLILCDPMDCSMLGFPVLHHLKLMSIESVIPSNHLILCHPLLLLPSIFLSIRVFSSELALYIG